MDQSVVSVIIPTYNRADVLANAIDSVLNQTHDGVEIIVVDDGSTDQTEQLISEHYFGKVKFIKKQNGGVGDARNEGLKYATGDYVAYLDSDDVWVKNKLEIYLKKAKSLKKPSLIFSDHVRIEGSGSTKKHSDFYSIIYSYFKENDHILSDSYNVLKLIYEPYTFYPSTFMLPRALHKKIKWRTKPRINEDLFFVLEASRYCNFVYLDNPLTYYYSSDDSISSSVGTSIKWSALAYEIISSFRNIYPLSVAEKEITDCQLSKLGIALLKHNIRKCNIKKSINYSLDLAANFGTYKLLTKKLNRKLN
jgi:glycosyltransferase involved in cell wall biosynthesis